MAENVTVIGRSARVRGRVTGSEDLEVRGFVDGEITVTGDVTVDAEGLVGAGIHGRRLIVRGAVKGDLVGEESIVLEDGAKVVGDVRAPRVAIAPGALVRGYVETGIQGTESSARTARAPHAAAAPRAAAPGLRTIAGAAAPPTTRVPAAKAAAPVTHEPAAVAAAAAAPPNNVGRAHRAQDDVPGGRSPSRAADDVPGGRSPSGRAADEAGPRRPPPPVVPALKKAKGQIVKKKER
jgi:cytoskeletal protein CcmA (bactofilin family)